MPTIFNGGCHLNINLQDILELRVSPILYITMWCSLNFSPQVPLLGCAYARLPLFFRARMSILQFWVGALKGSSLPHKRHVSSGEKSPCKMCRYPWMLHIEPRSQWVAAGPFMDNQRPFWKGKISIAHGSRGSASNLVSTSRNTFWQILPCFLVPTSKSSLCWSP